MGRGRPSARAGPSGKRGGRPGTASKSGGAGAAGAAASDDWIYELDPTEPLTTDTLIKLFNLTPPCSKNFGSHKGKDCSASPTCLAGIYSRPNVAKLAEDSVGDPPATAVVKDIKRAAGLRNVSNTCYLNAVLQCLCRIAPLVKAAIATEALSAYHVPITLARLLCTRFSAVNPRDMIDALAIDPSVQQDAQEFLSLFLALLGDSSAELQAVVKRELTGAMLYSRVCGACGALSLKTDTYIFLSVPVLKDATIADCIKASRAPETVVASCDKCNAHDVTITSTVAIKSLPRYLFIHFLRFQYDAVTQRRRKMGDAIQFEPFLPAAVVSGDESDTRTYRLRAVVNHLGASPDNGHYVAHIASPSENVWHLYDDEDVKESPQFDKGFAAGKTQSSKEVYLAVYDLLQDTPATGDEADVASAAAIPEALLSRIRKDEDETERMVADFAVLKADRRAEFDRWESLCEKVFPTNNAALLAQRGEDIELLTSYLVSSRWLTRFANGSVVTAADAVDRRISNRDIACQHGRQVFPSAAFRVVSPATWLLLKDTYGCDMELPLLDSMCTQCTQEYLERRRTSKDAFDEWASLKRRIEDEELEPWKLGDAPSEDPDVEPVFIAASTLDMVRDHREPPSEDVAALVDLTASLLCPHGGLSPDVARRTVSRGAFLSLINYGYTCAKPLPCKLTDVCSECTHARLSAAAATHGVKTFKFKCQKELSVLRQHDSNRAIFNRDLVKYARNHLKQWQEKRAQEEAERAAAATKEAAALAAAAAAERQRQSQQMAVNFVPARGQSKAAVSVSSSSSEARASPAQPQSPNTTDPAAPDVTAPADSSPKECPPRRVEHYVVPTAWVNAFNTWMDDSTHSTVEAPPKGVTCSDFTCEHGLSNVGVNDLHPTKRRDGPIGIVVKEDSIEALCTLFDVNKDQLLRLVELNEVRLTQPRECALCVEARRQDEERRRKFFEDGTLNIEGKIRKSKKHRVTVSSRVSPVSATMTLAALNAMVCTVLNSEYDIFVSGDFVKLFRNKTQLLDVDSTLLSHGIEDGDTLTVEIDEDQWLNEQWQAVPDSVVNEGRGRDTATFAGSALSGAGVDAGRNHQAAVKECPLCTYHNAPTRTICEMCESLL